MGKRKENWTSQGKTLNRDELCKLYWDEQLSTYQISTLLGIKQYIITGAMASWGIPLRNRITALKMRCRLDIPEDEVERMYIHEQKPLSQIAHHFGVDISVIQSRLAGGKYKVRNHSEAAKVKCKMGRSRWPQGNGSNAPGWRGGRFIGTDGYVYIFEPSHNGRKGKYVPEHHLVWESAHKRGLPKGWVIHHIDGDKTNNDIKNLVAMPFNKHNALYSELLHRVKIVEAENIRLRKALEEQQLIFYLDDAA